MDARKCIALIKKHCNLKILKNSVSLKIHILFKIISACHIMPNTRNATQLPSVTFEFRFYDKNNVYSRRRHLKKENHPSKEKNI